MKFLAHHADMSRNDLSENEDEDFNSTSAEVAPVVAASDHWAHVRASCVAYNQRVSQQLAAKENDAGITMPKQTGAVAWSKIAADINAQHTGAAHFERLPAPKQQGAASWSEIADKLNAETAHAAAALRSGEHGPQTHQTAGSTPMQAAADSWSDVVARLNAENGLKAPSCA